MANGIEDEVAKLSEQGSAAGTCSPRESCSSPIGYRFDGTLQRPYVFPGGLTFLSGGRKGGKNYCISPDKLDPAEVARRQTVADVHDTSPGLPSETPVHHGEQTSWISPIKRPEVSCDEDVRRQFTLKYDNCFVFKAGSEGDQKGTAANSIARTKRLSSSSEDVSNCQSNNSFGENSSFPLRKGVSLEILNKPTTDSYNIAAPPSTGRYTLPQGDSSCVYMGSFENLALLTLKRNHTNTGSGNETGYFKSKQKLFSQGRKTHYSLPTLNHDFVCMGSMDDMNIPSTRSSSPASSEEGKGSPFQRMGLGRCSMSMPDLSQKLEYTIFDLPPVMSDSEQSSESEDDDENMPHLSQKLEYTIFDLPPVMSDSDQSPESKNADENQSNFQNSAGSHKTTVPSKTLQLRTPNAEQTNGDKSQSRVSDSFSDIEKDSPQKLLTAGESSKPIFRPPTNPFSRNLGRASCMPGNKRFFIPPPPCYTPPKDEMDSVQNALSKLSCHKGSQIDISEKCLDDLDMEDRDQSLKRNSDNIRRLSSSHSDISKDSAKPLSVLSSDSTGRVEVCLSAVELEDNVFPVRAESKSSAKEHQRNKDFTEMDDTVLDCASKITSTEPDRVIQASGINTTRGVVTSTPKVVRKTSDVINFSKEPNDAPRPVPRQRKSLLKTQSMCIAKSKPDTNDNERTAKPIPRKRSNIRPRPQSEIIEPTSLTDYIAGLDRDQQNASTEKHEFVVENVDSVNSHKLLEPISEPAEADNATTDSEISPGNESGTNTFTPTLNTLPEDSKEGPEPTEARDGHTPQLLTPPRDPSTVMKVNSDDSGCQLATPGPIGCYRSYKIAVQKHSLYNEGDSFQNTQADSSTSNDEEMDASLVGPGPRGHRDDDQCVADDEMSMGEEDVTPKKSSDLLRGGSILDRSLILANKHRQRMRDRKCMSQVFSSTETDDADDRPHDLHGATGTSPARRKVVSFLPPSSDQSNVNKSMDSGTFSDYNASPSTSPTLNPSRVTFAEGDHKDLEDREGELFPEGGGLKRQISVQKKSWEVRLRKKHWMRKAGNRDHVRSWHCGTDVKPA